jgi:hypothetical protein
MILLAGCGGTSDTVTNLKVTNITTTGASANAAHPVELRYTLFSDKQVQNAVVSFYLIHNEQLASSAESSSEFEQYHLGTDVIETVLAGETNRQVSFVVSPDVISDGEYIILAHADPNNTITESNENDNIYYSHTASTKADTLYLTVSTAHKSTKNVRLDVVDVTTETVTIDQDDIDAGHPDDVDLTVKYPDHGRSHITSGIQISVYGAEFTAEDMSQIALKAQIQIGDTWHDLYMWNNTDKKYKTSTTLKEATTIETMDPSNWGRIIYMVHIETNIPPTVASAMLTEMQNTKYIETTGNKQYFPYRIVVDPDNTYLELDDTDNSKQANINVYSGLTKKRTANDGVLETTYTKTVGNKDKAQVTLDIYGQNKLRTSGVYGGSLTSQTSIDSYVMGFNKPIFDSSIYYSAQLKDSSDTSAEFNRDHTGYEIEVDVFGKTLYSSTKQGEFVQVLQPWFTMQQTEYGSKTYHVGPLPVTFKVTASANINFDLNTKLGSTDGTPIISVNDNLATVDVSLSSTATSSMTEAIPTSKTAMTLINAEVDNTASTNMTADTASGDVSMNIGGSMKAIAGKLGFSVEGYVQHYCHSGMIVLPCGQARYSGSNMIFDSGTLFDKAFTIYNGTDSWTQ